MQTADENLRSKLNVLGVNHTHRVMDQLRKPHENLERGNRIEMNFTFPFFSVSRLIFHNFTKNLSVPSYPVTR